MRISVFVDSDMEKAAEKRSYLVPLEPVETAILSKEKPYPTTRVLSDFLVRFGYGQLVDSADGSKIAHLTNVVLHPRRIVRTLGSRFFKENPDLLPFFDWENGNYICLVVDGAEAGTIVVAKDKRTVSPSLDDFMESMAEDPRFFLPKWDLSGPVPVRID